MGLTALLYSQTGDPQGECPLPPQLFGEAWSTSLLHEVTTAYRANRRAGTASTKTRSEVSGGGRKPWKQKGTGRARQGSIRSPLWRKGGIIFGPQPRSYRVPVAQQKRQMALRHALSAQAARGTITIVDGVSLAEPKTRQLQQWCDRCHLPMGSLLVVDRPSAELKRASRNLPTLEVRAAECLNAYTIMRAKKVALTRSALEQLVQRFGGHSERESRAAPAAAED